MPTRAASPPSLSPTCTTSLCLLHQRQSRKNLQVRHRASLLLPPVAFTLLLPPSIFPSRLGSGHHSASRSAQSSLALSKASSSPLLVTVSWRWSLQLPSACRCLIAAREVGDVEQVLLRLNPVALCIASFFLASTTRIPFTRSNTHSYIHLSIYLLIWYTPEIFGASHVISKFYAHLHHDRLLSSALRLTYMYMLQEIFNVDAHQLSASLSSYRVTASSTLDRIMDRTQPSFGNVLSH